MRLLVVSPFLPYPLDTGGAIRVYHLLRHLACRHDVVLLCFGTITADAASALRFCETIHTIPSPRLPRPWWEHMRGLAGPLPSSVCLSSDAMTGALRRLVSAQHFDIVQIEFLGLAHLGQVLDGHRKLLVQHCITSELRARQLRLMPWGPRRLYYAVDLPKIRRYERAVIGTFDGCVTVSARDEQLIRTWAPALSTATIPNGVDTDYFRPFGQEDSNSLLFIGSFHLDPSNVDAAVYLAREILPIIRGRLPQVHLTIVGTAPPREVLDLAKISGINVTGRVEDPRPYLARAALVVLPLRAGAGTKVRIFTGMAMEKTVLATPVAAEGIDAEPDQEIAIADGAGGFAEKAIALLLDPARRTQMGRAARSRAVAMYDWRVIGQKLEEFHMSLLDRSGG